MGKKLEDQGKGMEAGEGVASVQKKKRKKQKGFTVMVMGRVGKVRTFELSGRSVLFVLIFLILFIPSTIFFSNGYFQLRYEYAKRSKELVQAENDLDKAEKDLFETKRYYESLLYESTNNQLGEKKTEEKASVKKTEKADTEKKSPIPAHKASSKQSTTSKKQPATTSPTSPNVSPETKKRQEPKEVVEIQELAIHREGSYIDVDFKVVNMQPQEGESLRGYVHVIAETWDTFPPQVWTSPKEELKNGYPLNFRRGELFSIKRFKPINRRIDLLLSTDEPAIIRVLIYNQAGELKLEKEFEVKDAARKSTGEKAVSS